MLIQSLIDNEFVLNTHKKIVAMLVYIMRGFANLEENETIRRTLPKLLEKTNIPFASVQCYSGRNIIHVKLLSIRMYARFYILSFCVHYMCRWDSKERKINKVAQTYIHIHTNFWVKSLKRDKHNPRTISKGPIHWKNLILYCVQSIEHAEHLWRSSVNVYFYARV